MAQPQYSLSWSDHPNNISKGLSFLQKQGEFVDMTLAADGHLVKVHQVIMALSSPFIKDLIASANCQHPVIVLNKISHGTLSSILEYIYTGEVLVAIEDIRDLIDAAKYLHIKGLQEMNLSVTKVINQHMDSEMPSTDTSYINIDDDDIYHYEINKQNQEINRHNLDMVSMNQPTNVSLLCRASDSDSLYEMQLSDERNEKVFVTPATMAAVTETKTATETKKATAKPETNPEKANCLQYTVSTHGSLQLILNRFMYYLKNTKVDRTRQWRCVDYLNRTKCPAFVVTKDNMVLHRISAHKHPFHDKKILKKMVSKNVYSTLVEAERSEFSVQNKPTERTIDSSPWRDIM